MDLLGKKGEEAREGVEQVSRKVKKLQSHLDAIDSALDDHMKTSQDLMTDDYELERDQNADIEELESRLSRVEEDMSDFKSKVSTVKDLQQRNNQLLKQLTDSNMLDTIERVRRLVDSANKRFYDLQNSVSEIEERLNEIENEFVLEVNSRDYDFDRKLDKVEFEMEKKNIKEEINKLRTSVNVLSDEVDSPE